MRAGRVREGERGRKRKEDGERGGRGRAEIPGRGFRVPGPRLLLTHKALVQIRISFSPWALHCCGDMS